MDKLNVTISRIEQIDDITRVYIDILDARYAGGITEATYGYVDLLEDTMDRVLNNVNTVHQQITNIVTVQVMLGYYNSLTTGLLIPGSTTPIYLDWGM